MGEVRVRFVGGPADDLVRALPAQPDGGPPAHWVLRHPDGATVPGEPGADHLYERDRPGLGAEWTMRFVHSYPMGAGE
ncbi:hypothetical protein [Micromonospora mirobrigensis]|uniref:Uncharacterized protein n=1 Tax=Micromonospora mirobrigensis TaxID=262898 RepID=A0A1C4YU39_9ACTN|nr:hypothetical protein [Micromonospora mirobrigensis]SCF23851.1 hypothetical protein GA0070564_104353 [Micromonospora mirobrigensis]